MGSVVGLDVGTMHLCSALMLEDGKVKISSARNMFIEVDSSLTSISEIEASGLNYVSVKDNDIDRIFIISEDCLRFSQIFGREPKRPMSDGVISRSEIDAITVLKCIIEQLIGKTQNGYCVYSVPATPVDNIQTHTIYHEKVFSKILSSLGYDSKPLNEGMAVVFSECAKEKFCGIGISMGCGQLNAVTSYRGLPVFQFSIMRGGDYIDRNVSESVGVPIPVVTGIKERKLNLINPTKGKNRKEDVVLEALNFYYRELIEYCIKVFIEQFKLNSEKMYIEKEIPLIISGGTAMPPGFLELFKEIFYTYKDFPYEISEIRMATNPLASVATGCLAYSIWEKNKKE